MGATASTAVLDDWPPHASASGTLCSGALQHHCFARATRSRSLPRGGKRLQNLPQKLTAACCKARRPSRLRHFLDARRHAGCKSLPPVSPLVAASRRAAAAAAHLTTAAA